MSKRIESEDLGLDLDEDEGLNHLSYSELRLAACLDYGPALRAGDLALPLPDPTRLLTASSCGHVSGALLLLDIDIDKAQALWALRCHVARSGEDPITGFTLAILRYLLSGSHGGRSRK